MVVESCDVVGDVLCLIAPPACRTGAARMLLRRHHRFRRFSLLLLSCSRQEQSKQQQPSERRYVSSRTANKKHRPKNRRPEPKQNKRPRPVPFRAYSARTFATTTPSSTTILRPILGFLLLMLLVASAASAWPTILVMVAGGRCCCCRWFFFSRHFTRFPTDAMTCTTWYNFYVSGTQKSMARHEFAKNSLVPLRQKCIHSRCTGPALYCYCPYYCLIIHHLPSTIAQKFSHFQKYSPPGAHARGPR